MASKSNQFAEGAALFQMLLRNTDGQLGDMFNLSDLPPEALEIEQKYKIHGPVERNYVRLFERVGPTMRELGYESAKKNGLITYSGTDQYWTIHKNRKESGVFRYRFSANVPAELSVKIQVARGKNVVRGEFNLPMPDANVQHVRALMSFMCTLAQPATIKHFWVHQTGAFWKFSKPSGEQCEVVVYQATDASRQVPLLFAEIEPKRFENPEQALLMIKQIEEALDFKDMRCNQSIAQLFGANAPVIIF